MNWNQIFEKHELSCYKLYMWIVGEGQSVTYMAFSEKIFFDSLKEKGYYDNEERLFEFFDKAYILTYVLPLGFSLFQSVATSEYRSLICNQHTDRKLASIKTIENAFELLEERLQKHIKLKSTK